MQRTICSRLVQAHGPSINMKKLILWLSLICLPAGAQILSQIFFRSASASCGTPVTTNIKGWYSADCMTAISPCSTSYTDGHSFTTGETWLDRSSNADTMTIDPNEIHCVFKLNQINSRPSISFGGGGSGPDGSGNCGWKAGSTWDTGATSWAVFIVWQDLAGGSKGTIIGPNTTG